MSLLEPIDRSKRAATGEVPDASDRLAHRTRLFEQMAFLGCVTLALLSVFHLTMEMYALAVLQFPILFINIINLVSQRYHRRLELAMNIMLGTMFIVLLGTAMIGGVVNSGILWLPLYPILVFLLLGKGAGIYWVISYNISIFSLFIAELSGLDLTPFEADFVIYVFISTMVMSSLVYIYENQREKLVDELELERIRAEEASRAKSQFLANMSHEIRTPMNGIFGLINIMLKGELSRESRQHAELIQTSSETLMGLINDVLDISKIEAHKLEITYQAVELSKLIVGLMGLLKPGADSKNIGLKWELADDIPEWVMLDPLRLRQILLNIVGNAIKFTPEGEVTLIIERSNDPDRSERRVIDGWSGSLLHFMVRDSGIGIHPDKMDSIFEQFSQVDSTLSRQHGGSGLGLTISRKLAEMLGGRIDLESVVAEGSTFHLYIPLIEAESEVEVDLSQLPEKFELNVLVAEDDRINRFVVTRFLVDLGCRVDCVENGKRAVEAATSGKYDLLLMDLHMPQMDGRQATQAIRKLETSVAKIPIIALTANVISGEREACLAAGMNDFMIKPLQPERLREVLAKYQQK